MATIRIGVPGPRGPLWTGLALILAAIAFVVFVAGVESLNRFGLRSPISIVGPFLAAIGLGLIGLYAQQSPVIVLSNRGVRDKRGRIKWRHVMRATLQPSQGRTVVRLVLPVRRYYRSRYEGRDDASNTTDTELYWWIDLTDADTPLAEIDRALAGWLGERYERSVELSRSS